jgi:hypothetical protein
VDSISREVYGRHSKTQKLCKYKSNLSRCCLAMSHIVQEFQTGQWWRHDRMKNILVSDACQTTCNEVDHKLYLEWEPVYHSVACILTAWTFVAHPNNRSADDCQLQVPPTLHTFECVHPKSTWSHNYLMQNKIHNQGIKEWDTEQATALLLRSPVI